MKNETRMLFLSILIRREYLVLRIFVCKTYKSSLFYNFVKNTKVNIETIKLDIDLNKLINNVLLSIPKHHHNYGQYYG